MTDKKDAQFLPDTTYEGRDQAYLDVDRMVNEGMSGGSVHMRDDSTNIEQDVDLFEEDPPKVTD